MSPQLLLQRLVEMAGGPEGEGYILALASEGMGALPDTLQSGKVKYAVCQPETELALRRRVWQAGGAPFIALVPQDLAERLPPDLLRRARRARVHALDAADILSIALGAQVVGVDDPAVRQLALDHIDALRERLGSRGETLPTAVDALLLDELLMEVLLGRRLRGTSAAALLAELLERPAIEDPGVIELLRRQLPRRFGAEGLVLAWALPSGERLRALIERGVLLAIDEAELPQTVWGPLAAALAPDAIALPKPLLRRTVARLAEAALEPLGARASAYLAAAEQVGREILVPSIIGRSLLLPLGLENQANQLAKRAASGGSIDSDEVTWLKHHRAQPIFAREVQVIDELARLSRYLAVPEADASLAVADHVRRYQINGAFADVAALRLERALAATDCFHTEAREVLARWRQRRNTDNRHFAERLAMDYEAAIHDAEVIALPRLWQDQILPRLGGGGPGVFVVVLDGCSYPVFLELLWELTSDPVQPIGMALDEIPAAGATGLPGLSILPSVTSHARGALWLGSIPKDPLVAELSWRNEREAVTDPARFKQNEGLGARTRQLFLKGHLQADGGAGLRAALEDPALEVVAAVFNAIDDLIRSSNTSTPLEVQVGRIAGLLPALKTALRSGREVLLTADHGHSLFHGKDLRKGPGSTPRYCELASGTEPPDGFIAIDLAGLGGSEAQQAFAWQMGAYLGNQPQVGFHGGCSLEEMVVPMAWLAEQGVPADEPAWWFGIDRPARSRGLGPTPIEPIASAAAIGRARPAAPAAQPVAGSEKAVVRDAASLTPDPEPARLDPFVETFVGLNDADQRRALDLLVHNRVLTDSEMASGLGMRAARVRGFMRQLQRTLERDGASRITIELLPSGEQQYTLRKL